LKLLDELHNYVEHFLNKFDFVFINVLIYLHEL